ncbi:hypothetical protein TWF694_005459 [Orbilia ellipsospora]|uniref:F-box domain-containing protein n=1 Tax=Orbilia ellipsospora TaxID=2528407 RepID=A0AAV9WT85_9PEZI
MGDSPSQIWRVFNPLTREALPWCDSYENLISGPIACYLLNEIRAPEPDVDPFAGLDLPLVKLSDSRQSSSLLLSLPLEILYSISDNLPTLTDALSLSLTCRLLLAVATRKLRVELFSQMRGKWINQPLINLGSLTAFALQLPPCLHKIDFSTNTALTMDPFGTYRSAYSLTYRSGTRRQFFQTLECNSTLLAGYDRVTQVPTYSSTRSIVSKEGYTTGDIKRIKTPLEAHLESTNAPTWKKRLVERAELLSSGALRMYPTHIRYVVRNTHKKEYFRFEDVAVLKGEFESVFKNSYNSSHLPLDVIACVVFLFLISWSPSDAGLEDEVVRRDVRDVNGRWAGDTFDVSKVGEFESEGGWVDVAAETILLLRVYLPRMYRNTHGQTQFAAWD